MMSVDFSLDPDLAGGEHPYLVLYTWMITDSDGTDDADPANGSEMVDIISVSTTPQPMPLGVMQPDGMMTRNEAYLGETITAKVEIFEWDPQTGKVTMAQAYEAEVEVAPASTEAPVTPMVPTSVSFGDITTDTTGVVVTITATGEAAEAGNARLEASTNGSSGWITVSTAAADTSTAAATVNLDVDADGNNTGGDGGGLYYRVVYVYEGEDGDANDPSDDMEVASDVIQLGDVTTDPADITA